MADVNGTNGSDFLNFTGNVTTINNTFTNPYTGQTVTVNDTFNLTNLTYDGKNGSDFLIMTNVGDAIFATNSLGQASLNSIETIFAGDGGDLILTADANVVYGNMTIDGGAAHDIIWANAGNDFLNGRDGNDILDGGNGNDNVSGGNGNDWVSGGYGADIVNGGAGDDTLQFVADGTWAAGFMTINAFTGDTVTLEGFNQSYDHFQGEDGNDSVVATDGNDAIVAHDPVSPAHADASGARVTGIETFDLGAGNDILNLTSLSYSFGSITTYAGTGHDIIWSSAGNDWLSGGAGNDWLYGGDGDDTLYGGPNGGVAGTLQYYELQHTFYSALLFPTLNEGQAVSPSEPTLGVHPDDMAVSFETTVTMTFVGTDAGYRNSLGFYRVDTAGNLIDVHMAFVDARATAPGTSYTLELNGQTGSDFGLFIISDGFNANGAYSGINFNTGMLAFYYNYGQGDERVANIGDTASHVSLVWTDGVTERVLSGNTYHTTPRTGDNHINADNAQHVISGVLDQNDPTTLRVGFEDLTNLGDADYNDVTMDITIDDRTIAVPTIDDDDYLVGGNGNDTIYGGVGNDIIVGGAGADHLYGEEGNDIFVLDTLDGFTDTIHDFSMSGDHDAINIYDVLQGYDPMSSAIEDFVRLTTSGGNTLMEINADGDANGSFVSAALIVGGVGGASVADLLAGGYLVADQGALA
jgi:Ca2+-binding RTX toxin-like protein